MYFFFHRLFGPSHVLPRRATARLLYNLDDNPKTSKLIRII